MFLTLARLAFAISVIAGGASLARVSAGFEELGALGEIRFVGICASAVIVALATLALRPSDALGPKVRVWFSAVLVVHAYVIASWLWSDRGPYSLVQVYELVLLCVTLWIGVLLFRTDPTAGVRFLLGSFFAVAIGLVVASFALTGGLQGEIATIGAGGIGTARVLGMGVVAATFFALRSGRRSWLIPVPFIVGGMLLSGSRAAVLALVASLFYLWWQRRAIATVNRIQRTWRRRAFLNAVALAVVVVVILSPIGDALVSGFVQSLITGDRDADAADGQIYLADRDVIFADAWTSFTAHPIGGMGVGSYTGPFGEPYPHNLLLGFAVDAGILALVVSSVLLGYAFLRCSASSNALVHGSVAAAVFFMVASLFAGTYYDARFVWLFLILAFILRDHERSFREARLQGGIPGTLRFQLLNHGGNRPVSEAETPAGPLQDGWPRGHR